MKKIVAPLVPFTITTVLFLVMYNNSESGKLILILLVSVNLGFRLIPSKWPPDLWSVSGGKIASLCITCVLGTTLALEATFPTVLPTEYSQLLDLTKQIRGDAPSNLESCSLVFSNEDQRIAGLSESGTSGKDLSTGWHDPGKVFFCGYEPNAKTEYINRFHWNAAGYFHHNYDLEQAEGTERILINGDSHVEAVQIPLEKTFHKLLENP